MREPGLLVLGIDYAKMRAALVDTAMAADGIVRLNGTSISLVQFYFFVILQPGGSLSSTA